MTEQLPKRTWLTSQELCAQYGAKVSYKNASRTAKRLVQDYALPYMRKGNKWVS